MDNEIVITVVAALITSVIGPIAVHYAKDIVSKSKNSKDPLSESIKLNHTITEKLDELLNEYGGDRIWLMQFHNGGHFYPTGKSMQKFSMVYEVLKSSTTPCQHNFQNIPASLFSKSINKLHDGEMLNFDIKKDENQNHLGFTTIIANAGVKNSYVFPVFSIKNEFVAIVGIDYVSKYNSLETKEVSSINANISTIGGVLDNYLKG